MLEQSAVTCSEEEVKKAIMGFVGAYEQIPPMYSALKVNGKKLCDLARNGIEVERKPRPVQIYEIEIVNIELPRDHAGTLLERNVYPYSLPRYWSETGLWWLYGVVKTDKSGRFFHRTGIDLRRN